MAPPPPSLAVASGLLCFPQLFLVVSVALLILLVITCTSCRRLLERIRIEVTGRNEQPKIMSMKKHDVPVPKISNANGVVTTTDQQTGEGGNTSFRHIPSIHLTSLVQVEESNDDSLYEVVKDIQVGAWQPEQLCPEPQGLEYITPCKEVSYSEPRQMDECSSENAESVERQAQAPIYAKVVKQRNKLCQLQVQEKLEAKDEMDVEEPPPVPEKHLDDEDNQTAQMESQAPK